MTVEAKHGEGQAERFAAVITSDLVIDTLSGSYSFERVVFKTGNGPRTKALSFITLSERRIERVEVNPIVNSATNQ